MSKSSVSKICVVVASLFFISCGSSSSTSNLPAPSDVAAPPADAETTASGLAYKVLKTGTGESPTQDARVKVHYTGWTTDGAMFDS